MDDNEERCFVKIVTDSTALSQPSFIIKNAGKYYVSLAVWEYDPNAPNLTPEQKRDMEELVQLFEHARRDGRICEATELTTRQPLCFEASRTGSGSSGGGG